MDNLTHTLIGIVLSRAGLNRICPRSGVLLALASNVPDIDIVTVWSGGTLSYLQHHRGATHALVMSPVMALLPALVVWLAMRRRLSLARAWGISLVGVIGHLLLDWTNIYGIRLLWPFRADWQRLDIVSVIDPWIWILLSATLLWMLLARLVSSEIGARPGAGRGLACAALAVLCGYEFGRWVLHERAVATLESRIYEGQTPRRTFAFPSAMNPMRWTGLVEIRSGYMLHSIDLSTDFDSTAGRMMYWPEPSSEIEAARQTPAFQGFRAFSQAPFLRVTRLPEPEGAVQVEAVDLRFGVPGEGRFTAMAVVAGGKVIESRFQFTPPGVLPKPR